MRSPGWDRSDASRKASVARLDPPTLRSGGRPYCCFLDVGRCPVTTGSAAGTPAAPPGTGTSGRTGGHHDEHSKDKTRRRDRHGDAHLRGGIGLGRGSRGEFIAAHQGAAREDGSGARQDGGLLAFRPTRRGLPSGDAPDVPGHDGSARLRHDDGPGSDARPWHDARSRRCGKGNRHDAALSTAGPPRAATCDEEQSLHSVVPRVACHAGPRHVGCLTTSRASS